MRHDWRVSASTSESAPITKLTGLLLGPADEDAYEYRTRAEAPPDDSANENRLPGTIRLLPPLLLPAGARLPRSGISTLGCMRGCQSVSCTASASWSETSTDEGRCGTRISLKKGSMAGEVKENRFLEEVTSVSGPGAVDGRLRWPDRELPTEWSNE